jgi:hypothetical protein
LWCNHPHRGTYTSGPGIILTGIFIEHASSQGEIESILGQMKGNNSIISVGIPYLVRQASLFHWYSFQIIGLLLTVSIVAAFMVGIYISSSLGERFPSFLNFTRRDDELRAKVMARFRRDKILAIGAGTLSVLYGVIGNWCFYALAHHFGRIK